MFCFPSLFTVLFRIVHIFSHLFSFFLSFSFFLFLFLNIISAMIGVAFHPIVSHFQFYYHGRHSDPTVTYRRTDNNSIGRSSLKRGGFVLFMHTTHFPSSRSFNTLIRHIACIIYMLIANGRPKSIFTYSQPYALALAYTVYSLFRIKWLTMRLVWILFRIPLRD